MQRWDGDSPSTELVMVIVTHFFDRVAPDVDNIPKPILDALKGLVYSDDSQVTDLLCRKRNLNDVSQVQSPSIILNEAFDRGDEFLHIVVEDAPIQEVIS